MLRSPLARFVHWLFAVVMVIEPVLLAVPSEAAQAASSPPAQPQTASVNDIEGQPVTAAVPLPAPRLQATTPITLIPFQDGGYRYHILPYGSAGGLPGFEQPGFDDSAFLVGAAPFGSTPSTCGLSPVTDWPSNPVTVPPEEGTDILLRKTFTLPPGVTNLKIYVAIDNGLEIFINGQSITGGMWWSGGCAVYSNVVLDIPAGMLVPGENLLAIRANDYGVESYVDVSVVGEVPAQAPFIVTFDDTGYQDYSLVHAEIDTSRGLPSPSAQGNYVYMIPPPYSSFSRRVAVDVNLPNNCSLEEVSFNWAYTSVTNANIATGIWVYDGETEVWQSTWQAIYGASGQPFSSSQIRTIDVPGIHATRVRFVGDTTANADGTGGVCRF